MALHFTQDFIKKIKDNTDMLKLAEIYTKEPMKKTGDGVYQSRCPHPNHNDSLPSFTVWQKFQSWSCMGCHSGKKDGKNILGSDCIAFVQWIEGCSWRDAVLKLAEMNNISLPNSKYDEEYKRLKQLTNKFCHQLQKNEEALEYLYDRGITDKEIKDFMIGLDDGKIVFPLLDRFNNVLGFTKRWIEIPQGSFDKYRNSKNSDIFDKSKFFYGLNKVDMKKRYIRITEGPIDVIKATKNKAINVVATLGTAFTEEHAKIIKKLGLIPVLVYDGDNAGIKAMNKTAQILSEYGVFCKVIILPQGKDLDNLSDELGEYIEDYLKSESKPYGYYVAESLIAEYNSKIYEIKLEMLPRIEHILKDVPDKEKDMVEAFLKHELKMKA